MFTSVKGSRSYCYGYCRESGERGGELHRGEEGEFFILQIEAEKKKKKKKQQKKMSMVEERYREGGLKNGFKGIFVLKIYVPLDPLTAH